MILGLRTVIDHVADLEKAKAWSRGSSSSRGAAAEPHRRRLEGTPERRGGSLAGAARQAKLG